MAESGPLSELWRQHSQLAIDGNPEAIGALLEAYRKILLAIARQSLRPELAVKCSPSDVVQKTFEDAWIGFPQLRARNRQQFWAWLSALMMKNVIDVERLFLRSRKRDISLETFSGDSRFALQPDDGSSPASELILQETLERLDQVLQQLPDGLKAIIQWHFVDGMTFVEIGERVDRQPDAVRMLVTRAVKRLQREFFEE